ncbi:hypothetical protein BJY04DRAFT_190669 [Aspergillus karnatakaensis]|uniref:uncharacterized protein n=1 Tax=Aspergillus karnatakaensis TaxID=1810916 RepID=UPI003CCD58E4
MPHLELESLVMMKLSCSCVRRVPRCPTPDGKRTSHVTISIFYLVSCSRRSCISMIIIRIIKLFTVSTANYRDAGKNKTQSIAHPQILRISNGHTNPTRPTTSDQKSSTPSPTVSFHQSQSPAVSALLDRSSLHKKTRITRTPDIFRSPIGQPPEERRHHNENPRPSTRVHCS